MIRDFAIIQQAELEFGSGLNIITGETGAGKSIMVQAISLALGSRADSSYVRTGKEKALIQMVATLNEEEFIITRELNASGKNLCKVNGEIVSLNELSSLSKKIADIHGQYDHQALLHSENHISFVDSYHHSILEPLLTNVRELFDQYRFSKQRLQKLEHQSDEMERMKDFMKYQLEEIKQANLHQEEESELAEKKSLLQNSEKIHQKLREAHEITSGDQRAVLDRIYASWQALKEISSYSEELKEVEQEFQDIYYRLEEAAKGITEKINQIVYSPEELEETLDRLHLIQQLKKKYGPDYDSIMNFQRDLEEKLNVVENFDETRARYQSEWEEITQKLKTACEELTRLRKISAQELEKQIQSELAELGFLHAQLSIDFAALPSFSETGLDKIEFLIRTNKGEPLKPLSKIASGGEMSRIMLAFKKIIADFDGVASMIFDEIDSGISGIAASVVGKKLKQIASHKQVICITHLPQIAACGKQNFRIEKKETDTSTVTQVVELNFDEKIKEMARLLGGETITSTTLESAKELILASS
jgi:DNA repair protein RecN (Recombination protein N)